MDAHPALHPTEQSLRSYGLGQLDVTEAESVHKHLEGCPDCRRRADETGSFRPVVSSTDGLSMLDGAAAAAPPPASTLPPGLADHPDFEILRELGRGGMGVVYLARNKLMGRMEVLKVVGGQLASRPAVLERFQREIRSAARLQHPNIVTAYTALRLGESLVLSMEYVEGLDLSRLVKAKGPLPVANACNYVQQAALGLQHAYEHGMVHRDIKPANLILARASGRANKAIVKVLDFGLAKVTSEGQADSGLTREGQMLGTPDYIAPEQIRDAQSADIRADIYSLGCTLYYLLSGRPPFRGDNLWDIYQAHFSMDASPMNLVRPEVPAELAALIAKMMAKEPGRRFQQPRDVAQGLTPYFKKGEVIAGAGRAEPSRAGQDAAERVEPRGRAAAPPVTDPAPVVPPPTDVVTPTRRRPPWLWPAIVAGSVLGNLALGVIIITIRDEKGRETHKIVVPDGSKVVIEGSPENDRIPPPVRGRDDAAGRSNPVPAGGEQGSPTVSEPAAPSADPLRPGTSWRGTRQMLVRSWATDVGRPRNLWLTIKAREGTRFDAVADSPEGSHEAAGTFRDGAIRWTIAREGSSWEGKLDGDALVGAFKGTNRGGGTFSGDFRLTLAEDVPTAAGPARVPPAGPAREAHYVFGAGWTVEGDQLIKEVPGAGWVGFGDPDWTDYDLTFEARKSAGSDGFGACFGKGSGKQCLLLIGQRGNEHVLTMEESLGNGRWRPTKLGSKPGTIQRLKWYRVKISLRGPRIRVEFDDHLLFSCTDDSRQGGPVQLRFHNSAGRFGKIKVSAPDGTVLWEGPPDLP